MELHNLHQEEAQFEEEYQQLPVLPLTVPPSIQEVYGSIANFQEWFIPHALQAVSQDPDWLGKADFVETPEAKQKIQNAVMFLKENYSSDKIIKPSAIERTLATVSQVSMYTILPALYLRSLELLSDGHPELENLWHGGSYEAGQNIHHLKMRDFSLSLQTAKSFLSTYPRKRPCIFQYPVATAVKDFKEGRISAVKRTASNKELFGYDISLSTEGPVPDLGVLRVQTL